MRFSNLTALATLDHDRVAPPAVRREAGGAAKTGSPK
jgi:hypothetical protein